MFLSDADLTTQNMAATDGDDMTVLGRSAEGKGVGGDIA